jgi:hypothetical protein
VVISEELSMKASLSLLARATPSLGDSECESDSSELLCVEQAEDVSTISTVFADDEGSNAVATLSARSTSFD